MSNIRERKQKLSEILTLAKRTSWRRKSLEKRIGEIATYLSLSVYWFRVVYSESHKNITISACATYLSEVRKVTIDWYFTSTAINKAIVIYLELLLNDLKDYENTER